MAGMKTAHSFMSMGMTETTMVCPRCQLLATATARRRRHCTACGAALVVEGVPHELYVRAYLYGRPLHAGLRPQEATESLRASAAFARPVLAAPTAPER